jgi:hypothetical protein
MQVKGDNSTIFDVIDVLMAKFLYLLTEEAIGIEPRNDYHNPTDNRIDFYICTFRSIMNSSIDRNSEESSKVISVIFESSENKAIIDFKAEKCRSRQEIN